MSSAAFNPSGWSGYFTLTSKSSAIAYAVGQLYVDLSLIPSDSPWWDAVASDGRDIRAVNGNGDVAYSFRLVDNTFSKAEHSGVLHFDCSTWISTTVNQNLRIYAGNPDATMPAVDDPLGRDNVFSADGSPIAYWDMAQDPSGSSPQITDATGNGYDGTSEGSMASDDLVTGQVGKALDFDGVDDTVRFSCQSNLGDSGFTMSTWVYLPTASDNGVIMEVGQSRVYGSPVDGNGAALCLGNTTADDVGNNLVGASNEVVWHPSGDAIGTGWHMVGGAWSALSGGSRDVTLYIDGNLVHSTTVSSAFRPPSADAMVGGTRHAIGAYRYTQFRGCAARVASGVMDSDAILTHYRNEASATGVWTAGEWVGSSSSAARRRRFFLLSGAC